MASNDPHWIEKATAKNKGAYRKQTGTAAGQDIPKGTINRDAIKTGTLGKRARLAATLLNLRRKK